MKMAFLGWRCRSTRWCFTVWMVMVAT